MTKTKQGGRPPSYSPEQLAQAVDILEAKAPGQRPSAKAVKDELCDNWEISPGLNLQSLDRELERFLRERDIRRERDLVEALPAAVQSAGADAGKVVEREILAALGKGYAHLKSEAGRDVLALEKDKAQLHRRIEQLETEAADTAEDISRLNDAVARKDLELDECKQALDLARVKIRELESAAGAETRILAELSKLLGDNGLAVRRSDTAA